MLIAVFRSATFQKIFQRLLLVFKKKKSKKDLDSNLVMFLINSDVNFQFHDKFSVTRNEK